MKKDRYTDNYSVKNAETEIYWRYYRNTEKRALFFYLGGIRKHIKGTVRDLEK